MALIGSYADETVTLKSVTRDEWGTPTYTPSSVKGRVKRNQRIVAGPNGEDVLSSASVVFAPSVAVKLDDLVVLDGTDRKVAAVRQIKGLRRVMGWEAFLE